MKKEDFKELELLIKLFRVGEIYHNVPLTLRRILIMCGYKPEEGAIYNDKTLKKFLEQEILKKVKEEKWAFYIIDMEKLKKEFLKNSIVKEIIDIVSKI